MFEYLIVVVILVCALVFIGRNMLRQIKGAGLICQGCSSGCEQCGNSLIKNSGSKGQHCLRHSRRTGFYHEKL
jgi:hypothetical protein